MSIPAAGQQVLDFFGTPLVMGRQLKSRWILATLAAVAYDSSEFTHPYGSGGPVKKDIVLTVEQEAEAKRLAEIIAAKAQQEALVLARLLVSKGDAELLGATEFEVRDRVHGIGAFALQTAVNERKKRGTRGRA